MSPFCVLVGPVFSCFVPIPVFLEEISRQDVLGTTIPISVDLQHPYFVGLVRSAALRSPKGGAFRAQRRARPTTAAWRRPLCTLASPSLVGLPLATGDSLAVPTSVSCTTGWPAPPRAWPPALPACEAEVTALSCAPLDPALFEIQKKFERVTQMNLAPSPPTWARWLIQAHNYWMCLKRRNPGPKA